MISALKKADTSFKNIDFNRYFFNSIFLSASDSLSFSNVQTSQYILNVFGFCYAPNLLFWAKIFTGLFYRDYRLWPPTD